MWLLLRGRRAHAALDLDKGRIWSMAKDPFLTIDLPDGRLSIMFTSPEAASVAAEHLLQAIRESQEVIEIADGGWGEFQAEWKYFDPLREEQEQEAPSEEPEDEMQSNSWEPTPPTDLRLRSLWENAEQVREALRPKQADVEQAILDTCQDLFLSAEEIGIVLDRSSASVRVHFLNRMVNAGQLEKEFPGKRNHPRQRYRTATRHPAT